MAPTSPAADQLLSGSSQITRSDVPKKRACSVDENSVEAASSREDEPTLLHQVTEDRNSGSSILDISGEVLDRFMAGLEYKEVIQAKTVCKMFKARIESEDFCTYRKSQHPREGLLTALHFSVRDDGVWLCAGYDLDAKAWMKLPPFAMLPRFQDDKDLSICGAGGIMCVYVSASNKATSTSRTFVATMLVFNPLTRRCRELPPLNHPRKPVLMHMVLSPTGDSFKVIVAGSSTRGVGGEHLSKITEVFDSRTSKWTVTEELPGPPFSLNEFQNGAYKDEIVYCIGSLGGDRGSGLLAYSVEEGKWLSHLSCPLPVAFGVKFARVASINGEVVVDSEIAHNPFTPQEMVECRIDRLMHTNSGPGTTSNWTNLIRQMVNRRIDVLDNFMRTNSGPTMSTCNWRNLIRKIKSSESRGVHLNTHLQNASVPFGEGKLCIFNTKTRSGTICDMESGFKITGLLCSPTWNVSGEMNLHSYKPVTFALEPSFLDKKELELEHAAPERE